MSFTSNIQIQKKNPAVQYEPDLTLEPLGLWHEDHEIDGAMYRASNASYNESTTFWSLQNVAQPAYARVQNTDGSTSYLYMPASSAAWHTPAWLGTGQPLIYHAVNYGMSPSSTAAANTAALQAAVTAALNAFGGVILIPAGVYQISGTINLDFFGAPGNDNGLIITGQGGNTQLVQNGFIDLFSISGLSSGRGVRFKDLQISYTTGEIGPPTPPAAIRLSVCENVSCERVYFVDCPQALFIDQRSLHCGLFNCMIFYSNGLANMTMVTLGGSENYVDSCDFRQKPRSTGGPAGCTAIVASPGNGGGGYYITNTHLSDFTTGIVLQESENIAHLFCSNVVCESWTNALVVKPISPNGTIYQVFCGDCVFARTNDSTDTTSTGVIVDTNGGPNGNVADIFLNNCMCYQWNGPGVQIHAGQNIVITGGRYGSNATSMSTSGGIAITGTAASVTVSGADITMKIPNPLFGNQPYAISITAAVAGLYVRGCNLTGYPGNTGPLYLSSAGTQIEITDCAGYNDLGLVLSGPGAPPTGTFQNYSSWPHATSGWFGPIAFYISGGGVAHILIDTVNTGLAMGGFTLSPGETAAIVPTIPPATPSFVAVGK